MQFARAGELIPPVFLRCFLCEKNRFGNPGAKMNNEWFDKLTTSSEQESGR
jgi:hypothetical protein